MKRTSDRVVIRRPSGLRDLQWCARLMSTSEPWITLRRDYLAALALLRDPTREVFVATIGGKMAGVIAIVMSGAFRGYIQTVAVDLPHRGLGIGSQLIQFAERRILTKTPNVFICVSSFNPQAQKLYRRLGYQLVGELKNYVVRGHSELLLRKTTGPLADFRGARRRLTSARADGEELRKRPN